MGVRSAAHYCVYVLGNFGTFGIAVFSGKTHKRAVLFEYDRCYCESFAQYNTYSSIRHYRSVGNNLSGFPSYVVYKTLYVKKDSSYKGKLGEGYSVNNSRFPISDNNVS